MNAALVRKCVNDSRWLFLAMAVMMFGFCWLRVWIVSLIEMPRFAAIVEPLWDKFGQFSAVPLSHLLSYSGRVALTYIEPPVMFGVVIWAIARGSDAVSGELNRGTLEMLLGQPVTRFQILWTQAVVTVVAMAILCALCWLGIWVGLETTLIVEPPTQPVIQIPGTSWKVPIPFFGSSQPRRFYLAEVVSPSAMAPAALNLFALGFSVAGLATLMSAGDRYRWRSIGIVSAIFVIATILKIVGLAAEPLSWLRWFSFLTAFEPQEFVFFAVEDPDSLWALVIAGREEQTTRLGPLAYNGILLSIGGVAYALATWIFCRRDLPAPL